MLTNDYDLEGDTQTVTTTTLTNAGQGTVVFNTNGTYTFTPEPSFVGTTTFTYTVCDNGTPIACDTATLTIEVLPVVDGDNTVTAVDDTATTEGTNPVIIVVLANDFDMEGDTFTITTVSTPTNGTATLNPDGTITYTPNAGFEGQDTFTYTICDNGTPQACDSATVTVYVNPANSTNEVVANDDAFNTNIDTPINGNVILNDTDPEGDAFTVTANSNPTNGTLVINPNGTFTYTPNTGYFGPDSFTYTICDNGTPVACDTATVYITVNPDTINPPPPPAILLVDDPAETDMNEEVIIDIYNNDIGIPACATLVIITQPANGTLLFYDNGTPTNLLDDVVTYVPNTNYYGTDYFEYQVIDCDGNLSNIAIVTIQIGTVGPACVVEVYNAISPNYDGINDILIIQGLDCHPQNTVEIYNRWGVLVYETESYATKNNYFSGISEGRTTVAQGEELPDGTYFYIIKYVDTQDGNTNKQKTGYLYLNR